MQYCFGLNISDCLGGPLTEESLLRVPMFVENTFCCWWYTLLGVLYLGGVLRWEWV